MAVVDGLLVVAVTVFAAHDLISMESHGARDRCKRHHVRVMPRWVAQAVARRWKVGYEVFGRPVVTVEHRAYLHDSRAILAARRTRFEAASNRAQNIRSTAAPPLRPAVTIPMVKQTAIR